MTPRYDNTTDTYQQTKPHDRLATDRHVVPHSTPPQTSAALQRQAERAGLQHEEALASIAATRREVGSSSVYVCSPIVHSCLILSLAYIYVQVAERLREKISGVEAAMQESHMQLSQRLSSTVQRVRAGMCMGWVH